MILGYFTNKPLRLDPRFLGRFSGFISITAKISAQKFFLVAAIYEHLVGGLVKTLCIMTTIVPLFYSPLIYVDSTWKVIWKQLIITKVYFHTHILSKSNQYLI